MCLSIFVGLVSANDVLADCFAHQDADGEDRGQSRFD